MSTLKADQLKASLHDEEVALGGDHMHVRPLTCPPPILSHGMEICSHVKTQWRAEKLFVKEGEHFVEHKVLDL